MNVLAAIAVIVCALSAAVLIMTYPALRRRWYRGDVLPPAEARRLLAELPWRDLLDARQRHRLLQRSAEIIARVDFVGCQDLYVTPEMRRVIAGQAALLSLGTQPAEFNLPREVLIYPDAFYIPPSFADDNGLVDDQPMLAAGEAWDTGRVVLSWADVEDALAGADHNVVLHEFAHLLDFAEPRARGAPPMAEFDSWANALDDAYEQLRRQGSTVLDVYGAENPTEFFAVAVEAFFQRGTELAVAHEALHRVMAAYFDIDTARQPPRFDVITPRRS